MLRGRAEERARLAAVVEAAARGSGASLLVLGEPGTGKTALLDDAARAYGDRAQVLRARGVASEVDLPNAALADLLAPLRADMERLAPYQRQALDGALGFADAAPGDRFALYVGVLTLLSRAAERRPVLALVDDAHWVDEASKDALAFVARRLAGERIAIVLASREREALRTGEDETPVLEVRGLDRDATAEVIGDVRGVAPSPHMAQILCEETGGNPLAITELAAALSEAELTGAAPAPAPLPVGESVRRSFGRRLAELPEPTRAALVVVASAGRAGLADIEAAVEAVLANRWPGLAPEDALRPAEEAGVIRFSASTVEWRHPLMHAVVLDAAPGADRRAAHRALADTAAGASVRQAWHLAATASVPDERVAGRLEAAAGSARAKRAPRAAARAFEAAARLSETGVSRGRRLLEAARDLYVAGAAEEALAALDEALAAAGDDPRLRADAHLLRARVGELRSAPAPLRASLMEEADRVAPVDAGRAVTLRLEAVTCCLLEGEPAAMLALAERVCPAVIAEGGYGAAVGASLLGIARVLTGRPHAAGPLLRQAEHAIGASPDVMLATLFETSLAQVRIWTGQPGLARAALTRLERRARDEGVVSAMPFIAACISEADFHLGRWPAAAAAAVEAITVAETTGQHGAAAHGAIRLACVHAGRGDEAACRAALERAGPIASDTGSLRSIGGYVAGLLEVSLGRHPAAARVLASVGRVARASGLAEPGVVPWAQEYAEALIRQGCADDARFVLSGLGHHADDTGRRTLRAVVQRCHGLAAREDFEPPLRAALDLLEEADAPFERSRTQLCLGERLRRAGRRRDARVWLEQASEVFVDLGATAWLQRADAELAATGIRARRRDPSTASQLTPQELRVAQLVAEGATNREAASALFVTPKTIDTHLSSVYRKLGVRSRVELSRRLRGEDV